MNLNFGKSVTALSKSDFQRLSKQRRIQLIEKIFRDPLIELFSNLKKDAIDHGQCHRQVTLTVPNEYDIIEIKTMILEYFKDLEYVAISSLQTTSTSSRDVVLTLS